MFLTDLLPQFAVARVADTRRKIKAKNLRKSE